MTITRRNLPIRLELTPVHIIGTRDVSAIRWTLGPEWYYELVHNDDPTTFVPYADDETPGAPSDTVKEWAEIAIARTTPYRVTGWNGETPTLEINMIHMEVNTTDGRVYRTPVEDTFGTDYLRRLYDGNDVLVFPGVEPTAASYIPVRSITRVDIHRYTEPVVND